MSYSILRRYTPPTCTLEIMAKNSPLSRWAGQPVLKQLRFQLSLDDPKLPQEEWIMLKGDRAQLETLHETVSAYVQALLEQSYSHLNAGSMSPPEEAIAVLPATQLGQVSVASAPHSTHDLSLRPKGLLTHELTLGALATSDKATVVPLSVLQLFDLANALDDYASELLALPELARSHWLPTSLNWGQLAATGLIVIGLSASIAKLIDNSRQPASPTASQGASSSDQQIATQLPPSVIESPLPSITSAQKLPPPPPIGSTVPGSPGLPIFTLPSPSTGSQPSGNAPSGTITLQPNSSAPPSSSSATGNQIAMLPQTGASSEAARSRSAPTMPQPLALKRELPNAAPSQPSSQSLGAAASSASDRGVAADQTGTAFDTIPQVAEARQYFQRRWTPPQGLTQTLEYTLFVGANGSLQRTMPLGQAAGDYVDRTGIPLVGEPFVAALSSGRNAKIRLVLSPDGSVKTFLEGFY